MSPDRKAIISSANSEIRVMAQVFVVVAAGSVITFIIRDLGDASLSGWIIVRVFLIMSDTCLQITPSSVKSKNQTSIEELSTTA